MVVAAGLVVTAAGCAFVQVVLAGIQFDTLQLGDEGVELGGGHQFLHGHEHAVEVGHGPAMSVPST